MSKLRVYGLHHRLPLTHTTQTEGTVRYTFIPMAMAILLAL
jgi:hypothetical protein